MTTPPIPSPTSSPLLQKTLRTVARRYRLPPVDGTGPGTNNANTTTVLALSIEQGRLAVDQGKRPGAAPAQAFVEALARMVHEAMRPATGDPVFQAMVLRHQATQVREYASLSARAEQDRRQV